MERSFNDINCTSSNQNYPDLHVWIVRTTATFWRHPVDDLVGIHDVTRFAVDTVARVDLEVDTVLGIGLFFHLIHSRRTEVLAGITKLFDTP